MQLEPALDQLLAKRLKRVRVNAGNGLTRQMNASLRSYDEIPVILRRTVACLATLELLFGVDNVSIGGTDLYQLLSNTHDDWYHEVPTLPPPRLTRRPVDPDDEEFARPVTFERKPRLPFHQFTAAWTIGRRIRLLTGHGTLRLHSETRRDLQRLMQSGSV